ncbi:MAG: hypothetical protein K9K82_05235 [Desulfobacteraceae bacterium]|nr:hypothetical protein [Desulfobacteraceae bacterium]
MGTREKILVGLMILAVAYGAVELFFIPPEKSGNNKTSGPDVEAARQMTQKINARIDQADLSPRQEYILELTGRKWQRDPFYLLAQQEEVSKTGSEKEPPAQNLKYTGYLEIGDTKMAIINGVEYRTGQRLEPGAGVVQSISPEKVVIKSLDTGQKISIPYSE